MLARARTKNLRRKNPAIIKLSISGKILKDGGRCNTEIRTRNGIVPSKTKAMYKEIRKSP